jgi:hypothetical protein
MRFLQFKEYRPQRSGRTSDAVLDVIQYLTRELKITLRELSTGLEKLSFLDNFKSFQVSVEIPTGEEVAIRNQLSTIPTQRIIVRSNEGGLGVVDGDTAWTTQFVYLKNTGLLNASVTVLFLA